MKDVGPPPEVVVLFPVVNTTGEMDAVQYTAVGVAMDIVGLEIGGLKFCIIVTIEVD